MALYKPVASRETQRVYAEGLAKMIEIDRAPAGLPERFPLRLFVLNLADVTKGRDLASVQPAAWQFYLGSSAGPAIALTVAQPRQGEPPKMSSMTQKHDVRTFLEEVREVERFPEVKVCDYELRLLRVPTLVAAFWLRSLSPGNDLIVPYRSVVRRLKRMKGYPADKFFAILRPVAERRLKPNTSPSHPAKSGKKTK